MSQSNWGGAREGSGRKPTEETWLPVEVRRRCATCPTVLSRYNSDTQCNVCRRKEELAASAKRIKQMEPTSRSIPSARLNVKPRTKAERIDMQLKAWKKSTV